MIRFSLIAALVLTSASASALKPISLPAGMAVPLTNPSCPGGDIAGVILNQSHVTIAWGDESSPVPSTAILPGASAGPSLVYPLQDTGTQIWLYSSVAVPTGISYSLTCVP